VGWNGNVYVLRDRGGTVIGSDARESYLFQGEKPFKPIEIKGTLEGWRNEIAAPCVGNSCLIFTVSLAFAAPLLYLVEAESGGFHLFGSTSSGKTTCLQVGTSVHGSRLIPWRTTDNALEGTACAHNDGLLLIDEISTCPPEKVGNCAYMLGNGDGKSRMTKTSDMRPTLTWRLLFISTGEQTLGDYLRQGKFDVRPGQETRFVDLSADAGLGMGAFEDLHGVPSAHAFADLLKKRSAAQCGTAGRKFIEELVADRSGAIKFVEDIRQQFMATVPPSADGQVQRVAGRFALVAAAGELASAVNITGWASGVVWDAAQHCFQM
jgi:uncharacterized protein (DUF927 family)